MQMLQEKKELSCMMIEKIIDSLIKRITLFYFYITWKNIFIETIK